MTSLIEFIAGFTAIHAKRSSCEPEDAPTAAILSSLNEKEEANVSLLTASSNTEEVPSTEITQKPGAVAVSAEGTLLPQDSANIPTEQSATLEAHSDGCIFPAFLVDENNEHVHSAEIIHIAEAIPIKEKSK